VRPTASDSSTPIDRTRVVLAQCLAALLAIAVYAPALDGPFVWDDRLLLETPQIAELAPMADYFLQPFWQVAESGSEPASGRGAYYRPLATLSLALDRHLHGDNPAGFHLIGLVLHAVNTTLVLSLARRLGATLPAALAGALLFAWFPRLTESVAWISGRTDVMASTFALLALQVTLGSWPWRRFLAAICLVLGAFCKEVALAAAVGIFVWEWRTDDSASASQRSGRVVPTVAACVTYLGLRTWVLTGSTPATPLTLPVRLLASLEAVARYALMLVDGWQPRLQIGYLAQPNGWLAALGLLLLPLVWLALRKARPQREQQLFLVVAFVAVAMVLHLVPIQGRVVAADRFLYLPVAALGVLLAVWMSRRWDGRAAVVGFALALSYAPVTWQRARVFGDDIAFWGTAVAERASALNAHARLGFGNLLAEHGLHDDAARQYALAQPGDAGNWMLCQYNRAGLLATNGEFDAAVAILEQAYAQGPSATLQKRLALLHASKGEVLEARAWARKYAASAADPRQAEELDAQVTMIANAMPALARPVTTLPERLARARGYAELGLYRLAMAQLVSLLGDPGITPAHLQGMLTSALEHGTPEQLEAVQQRLEATSAAYPSAYAELVRERLARVRRLRAWTRELAESERAAAL